MVQRRTLGLTLVLAMLTSAGVRAQDQAPTFQVQIHSLNAVIDNVTELVQLAGQKEIAKQVEALIKTKIGVKGLEGIDPTRPFGAYARFGKNINDGSAVVLVPIADENAFLNLLENLNFKGQKNPKTGIYTIKGFNVKNLPIEVFFRFADNYAYLTALNLDALETGNMLAPQKVFRAGQQSALSMTLRLDQIPKDYKLIPTSLFEQYIQDIQEKKIPGETAAQKAFRLQATKEVVAQFHALLNEGQQLSIDLDINKSTKQMAVTMSLTPQSNTSLAKTIADIGKARSLFGNFHAKDAAMHASLTVALPKSMQKVLVDVVDQAEAEIVKKIKIYDPDRKKQAEDLIKALSPTFKAGEADMAVGLYGPNKDQHYTMIWGVKVRQGAGLRKTVEKLLEEAVQQMPPKEREKLQLNVAKVGAARIHRFDLGEHASEQQKKIFGEGPNLFAFSDGAVYLAMGSDSMKVLRAALASKSAAAAPALNVEISLARLWPLFPDAQKKNREKLQELFDEGKAGTIRLSVEGGTNLTVRFSSQLSIVEFIGAAVEKK